MSDLEKRPEKGNRTMRPAVEIAAERWGMSTPRQEEAAPEKVPEKVSQKRNFKEELTAWGERPQPNEPFVRSDTHEIREPERDE